MLFIHFKKVKYLKPRENNGTEGNALRISLKLLRATRGARIPNLQVVVTHASHVCSLQSFRLPLRMNGMHITHFDHARLDLLSLVI